jgi:hypothetical protein
VKIFLGVLSSSILSRWPSQLKWWWSNDWNLLQISWIIKYCCVWLKTYIYIFTIVFFNFLENYDVIQLWIQWTLQNLLYPI